MTTIKEGDRVQIADRAATADDVKSGLFYNHFRGLTGTVQKLYSTEEVSVQIELEALPEAIATRHRDVQEQMKSKWLDGLSEEARNRLTDQERDFRLHYTILVAPADIVSATGKAKTPPPIAESPAAETVRRATSADLAAAEEAEIERRKRGE